MAPSSSVGEGKPKSGPDEERFIQLVAEILGVDEQQVGEEPSLVREMHLDSLDVAELLMHCGDEFKWP